MNWLLVLYLKTHHKSKVMWIVLYNFYNFICENLSLQTISSVIFFGVSYEVSVYIHFFPHGFWLICHHLWNRLFFPHWVFFPFDKSNWQHLFGSFGFCILFCLSICPFLHQYHSLHYFSFCGKANSNECTAPKQGISAFIYIFFILPNHDPRFSECIFGLYLDWNIFC